MSLSRLRKDAFVSEKMNQNLRKDESEMQNRALLGEAGWKCG
jgi:hypothetical protein